jgi:hypothetical protein
LITNARCLTEGIDVPAVDMVAFIDPRHSKIDIAQATGRAMRKPGRSDKTIGYVVVPLFLVRRNSETLDEAFRRSEFDSIATILNAMQEQDEDLAQIIREIQEAKGRGEVFNPQKLTDKIEVLGPSVELSTLRSNIFVEVVDRIGVRWDEWYGCIKRYKEREGHCRVPFAHIENGLRLGFWVNVQRTNGNLLSADRRRRLDELGFVWNLLDAVLEEGFSSLKSYKHREGHCLVPALHIENGFRLGSWVQVQRGKKQVVISIERQHRLDALGFVWDVLSDQWDRGFEYLKRYKEREGHCRVSRDYKENGFKLGRWVSVQRLSRETLSAEKRKRLDALGFIWDALSDQWEHGFEHLKRYKGRESHCRVPDAHTENGFNLGKWVGKQRQTRESMPVERRQRLDALGFVWDALSAQWENGFTHLKSFREREGHCKVPQLHTENGFRLGLWVATQRQHKSKLSAEQRRRLDELGFVWTPHESAWEDGFSALKSYKKREGHCDVPSKHVENGVSLGSWVRDQRSKRATLSTERRRRLDELGFAWAIISGKWENAFSYLKSYNDREGHCRVPTDYKVSGFRLGSWVREQRSSKDTMPTERRQRLDELRFVWDVSSAQWEKAFNYLSTYKEREGDCLVPFEHIENGFRLGGWVNVQRTKKSQLSAERRQRLDEVGFLWRAR